MPRSSTNLRTSLENLNNSVLACEIINKNINKVGKPWEQLREQEWGLYNIKGDQIGENTNENGYTVQGGNKSGDCISYACVFANGRGRV